jgi:two-component system, NarL family, sensor kinase
VALIVVGFAAMLVISLVGVTVVNHLAESQAIADALSLTRRDALKVQSKLTDRMVSQPTPRSSEALSRLVEQSVQPNPGGPVVRVKIWTHHGGMGRVVYSDASPLIGFREPLEDKQLDALRTGGAVAELSELDSDEHRFERGFGPLTEVYSSIETPGGRRLLFETYQRSTLIADAGRQIANTFTPVLVLTLVVAAVVELLLAVALIRRFRRGQQERETLMHEVIEASFRERRIIAGDLHDGPVQEMAGLSFALTAEAEAAQDEHVRASLGRAAGVVRNSVRALRSAIVGIYPPNLEKVGLEAALTDLVARLRSHEISGHLTYDLHTDLNRQARELLYRSGQEAIRNIEKHAAASNVWVSVSEHDDVVSLDVRDDGRGGACVNDRVGDSGRFGLAVLADIIQDAGGELDLDSGETGTTVKVSLPV